MTNNNKVKWFLNGELQAACESCKFPRHDGPCGSASSFLNQDEIATLNIGCEYCREAIRHRYWILRASFPVKLTYDERNPVFDSLQIDYYDFKGPSDVESQFRSFTRVHGLCFRIDDDEFKRQLKESVHSMSSSGQHLWKTMFGNVKESIDLLCTLYKAVYRNSSHLFSHQMAYFLSAIDIGDKDSFLRSNLILYIVCLLRMEDIYMLIPIIGLDRVKAIIVNVVDDKHQCTLELAFLLFAVKNRRVLEQAGELDKRQVRELACKYGVPYVYVNSDSDSSISLDAFRPLERMKISTPNSSSRFRQLNSSSRFKLQPQNVSASAQLEHKKEVHSQNIKLSINVGNVRCHILSDIASDQEKYFPSRIQIRVIPSNRTPSLTVGKSSNDAPYTLYNEEEWEAGIQIPKGPAELKIRRKSGSSSTHTNWRFEMNECLDNPSAGYFDWTLFDNANGVEVWKADSKNYKKLMDRRSSLRNRGSQNSPFNREGGCVFSGDLYGQPLTWTFDRRFEGTTSSWTVEMDVWLTCCCNVGRNDCFQTASWSFTGSLEMKL